MADVSGAVSTALTASNVAAYDPTKRQTYDRNGNVIARGDAADAYQQNMRALARNRWRRAVKKRGADRFVPNTATVVYIDPSAGSNGSGTFASPLNGAGFFALQTSPGLTAGNTYLFKGGTTLTQTGSFVAGAAVISIPGPGTVFGSYDPVTGQRIIDKGRDKLTGIYREATIDAANLRPRIIQKSSGTANIAGSAVSGLRLINAFDATNPRAIFISAGSSSPGFTFEHCVIEQLSMSATDSSRVGMACEVYIDDFVARFNRIVVKDCDGIYMGRSGGTGAKRQKVYGNEVVILKETTDDGVDCVQVYCPVDGVETLDISDNWAENRINAKQVIMLEDNSGIDAAGCIVERNFCMGSKLDTGHTSQFNQKVINANIKSAVIRHNYVEAGEKGIFLALAGARAYGNLILMIGGDGDATLRSGVEGYQASNHIQHNTIVSFAQATGASTVKRVGIYHHGGAASLVQNNVVVGELTAALHVMGTDTEAGNILNVSGIAREDPSTGASIALGSGSTTIDPQVSMAGWPLIRPSPVATPVITTPQDVWGSIWRDYPGAVQQQPSLEDESETLQAGNTIVRASRSLTEDDNNQVLELAASVTLTLDRNTLAWGVGFNAIVRLNGFTLTVALSNGSKGNGDTINITRAGSSTQRAVWISESTLTPGNYEVSGT